MCPQQHRQSRGVFLQGCTLFTELVLGHPDALEGEEVGGHSGLVGCIGARGVLRSTALHTVGGTDGEPARCGRLTCFLFLFFF